jgi:hypothetical protein
MSAHVAGAAGPVRRPGRPATAAGGVIPSPSRTPYPGPAPTTPEWSDLAANRPGSGAVERAQAAHRAAPIRSSFGRVLLVTTQERKWRLAAVAQRKVGQTLSRLDPAWRVLHSVPVGAEGAGPADIDHLLIGPPGVFTLTSKYHRGGLVQVFGDAVRVDGSMEPYVSEARYEAWRAACLLTAACGYRILAAPAVVIVGADDVRVARPPEGVEIIDRRHLLRWLTCQPHRLRSQHVEHIFAAARRSDTWLRRPATLHRDRTG